MLFRVVLFCACVTVVCACRCLQLQYPASFCNYAILFRGQAVYSVVDSASYTRHHLVRVDQTFRMPSTLSGVRYLLVSTFTQGSLCGFTFDLNTDYVFAGRSLSHGAMRTGSCDPNIRWSGLSSQNQALLTSGGLDQYCANPPTKSPILLSNVTIG